MQQGFVHLRLHTEFSIVDGLVRLPELLKELPKRGMDTVAVTDFCNLFAVVKLFQSAVAKKLNPSLVVICHVTRQKNRMNYRRWYCFVKIIQAI